MWDPDHREPERPYSDNPSIYEQACLREVMRTLAGVPVYDPRERAPRNVHAACLKGEYPDTKLVVVLSRDGPAQALVWRLWSDDFGHVLPDQSNRAAPVTVSDDVWLQVWELNA